jgi:hypothetical protein
MQTVRFAMVAVAGKGETLLGADSSVGGIVLF